MYRSFLCINEEKEELFVVHFLNFLLLQQGFHPVARSSLSSSPSEFSSAKGNEGGGGESSEEDSKKKTKRANDGVDGGTKGDDALAGRGEEGGQCDSSLSMTDSSSKTQISLARGLGLEQSGLTQFLGTIRMAPTMVTNVVKPIASTPIPIASKPVEAAITLSSLCHGKKATLLIGGGRPQQLPITTGGGYLFSFLCPCPFSITVGVHRLLNNKAMGTA